MAMASSARARRRSSGLPCASSEHKVARTRARSGWAAGKQVERPLQGLDLLPVGGTHGAVEAAVVGQDGSHQPVDIADVGRLSSGIEERRPERRVPGLPLCGPEPDGQVEHEDRIRVTDRLQQLEGLGVVPERVVGRQRPERVVGRLVRVADRHEEVGRGRGVDPVPGEFTHPGTGLVTTEVLQRQGDAPRAFAPAGSAPGSRRACAGTARGRSCTDPERRPPPVPGTRWRRPRGCRGGHPRDPGGPFQDVEIEVPPDDGRRGQHPVGIGPEPHDPTTDHLTDALGESGSVDRAAGHPTAGRVLVDGPGVAQMTEHLGHEERVAVGLTVDRLGQTKAERVEALTGYRFEQ